MLVLHLQEIWPKLSSLEEDKAWYRALQLQQKQLAKHYEEGCAALPLLEGQVVDAACSDPGAVLLPHLILPLLQQEVESKALAAAKVRPQHEACHNICNRVNDIHPNTLA